MPSLHMKSFFVKRPGKGIFSSLNNNLNLKVKSRIDKQDKLIKQSKSINALRRTYIDDVIDNFESKNRSFLDINKTDKHKYQTNNVFINFQNQPKYKKGLAFTDNHVKSKKKLEKFLKMHEGSEKGCLKSHTP